MSSHQLHKSVDAIEYLPLLYTDSPVVHSFATIDPLRLQFDFMHLALKVAQLKYPATLPS